MDNQKHTTYTINSEEREVFPDKWKTQLSTKNTADISVSWIGHMIASPTQFFTNFFPRNDYCIQYTLKGKGDYFSNNKLYHLQKGSLWLLPKKQYHYYASDKNDPYEYVWLHIDGKGADYFLEKIGLTENNPVISDLYSPDIVRLFMKLIEIARRPSPDEHLVLAALHELLYEIEHTIKHSLVNRLSINNDHAIDDVISFIKSNYNKEISVKDLANVASLNELYFIKKFREKTGITPIQFLNQYRVSQSCSLLHENISLTSIAKSCGFKTLTNYLRRFKDFIGLTPTQYRQNITPPPKKIRTKQNSLTKL